MLALCVHRAAQARGGEPRVAMPEQADGRVSRGCCFTDPGSILDFVALTRAGVREDIAASLAGQPVPLPLDRHRQVSVELPSCLSVRAVSLATNIARGSEHDVPDFRASGVSDDC